MSSFKLILDSIVPRMAVDVGKITPEVQDVAEIERQEAERRKKIQEQQNRMNEREIRFYQEKIQHLQQQSQSTAAKSATNITQPPPDTNLENVERQEKVDQEEKKRQDNVDLINKLNTQNTQQNAGAAVPMVMGASRRWIRSERADAKIIFNNNTTIYCDVAATPLQQSSGLQAYNELAVDRGLWFPQVNRRIAAFHMGDVKYPIDIIFVDGNKIAKIVDNIRPSQFGTWSAICTDVIEVNGNWTIVNNVNPGDLVVTPLYKDANRTSFDPLRSLTEASGDNENWEEELLKTFPFLRKAQENKSIKPNTFDREPGDVERRNPAIRFEDRTLPDEYSNTGDGGSTNIDPLASPSHGGFSSKHFEYVNGPDPALTDPERVSLTPVKPESSGLKAPVRTGSIEDFSDLEQKNLEKLMYGSIVLLSRNPLEWGPSSNSEYTKEAMVADQDIDDWIASLGWEEDDKNKLWKIAHTDNYKKLLGKVLQDTIPEIKGFEIKDSNLYLYR